ncbi:unnamed protein product, partial [Ixodes persulcatus]
PAGRTLSSGRGQAARVPQAARAQGRPGRQEAISFRSAPIILLKNSNPGTSVDPPPPSPSFPRSG